LDESPDIPACQRALCEPATVKQLEAHEEGIQNHRLKKGAQAATGGWLEENHWTVLRSERKNDIGIGSRREGRDR